MVREKKADSEWLCSECKRANVKGSSSCAYCDTPFEKNNHVLEIQSTLSETADLTPYPIFAILNTGKEDFWCCAYKSSVTLRGKFASDGSRPYMVCCWTDICNLHVFDMGMPCVAVSGRSACCLTCFFFLPCSLLQFCLQKTCDPKLNCVRIEKFDDCCGDGDGGCNCNCDCDCDCD